MINFWTEEEEDDVDDDDGLSLNNFGVKKFISVWRMKIFVDVEQCEQHFEVRVVELVKEQAFVFWVDFSLVGYEFVLEHVKITKKKTSQQK